MGRQCGVNFVYLRKLVPDIQVKFFSTLVAHSGDCIDLCENSNIFACSHIDVGGGDIWSCGIRTISWSGVSAIQISWTCRINSDCGIWINSDDLSYLLSVRQCHQQIVIRYPVPIGEATLNGCNRILGVSLCVQRLIETALRIESKSILGTHETRIIHICYWIYYYCRWVRGRVSSSRVRAGCASSRIGSGCSIIGVCGL